MTGCWQGRKRKLKSCLGVLSISQKQVSKLGINPYVRISPLLSKCCQRLSANESYLDAEKEIEALTGVKVSHSTLQRSVQSQEYELPETKQAISEVSIDGGKVRLRGKKGEKSYWRDYKGVRLQGIYYGAFFQDNLSATDWINTQRLVNHLYCLGDGHDGIWNLFEQIGTASQRREILDWYHLKENLYKVGGSLKRLGQAETLLWQGLVDEARALFADFRRKQAVNFCAYLDKHRSRIVNYKYFQAEQISSIGSGAVESAVKQIDRRMKISGAQWQLENVQKALQLRASYLNGLLAI